MSEESLPEKKPRGQRLKPLPAEKKCGKCLQVKPQASFHVCREKTVDGRPTAHLSWACTDCRGLRARQVYAERSGKPREYFDAEFRVAVKTHKKPSPPKRECLDKMLEGVEWAVSRLPEEKRCRDCQQVKPRSEFNGYVYRTDNHKRSVRLQQRCKPCEKAHRASKLVRDRTNKAQMRLRKYRRELIEDPDAHCEKHPVARRDDSPLEKSCCICRDVKSWQDFLYRSSSSDGLSKECRACIIKASIYRSKYGLGLEDFELMAADQVDFCTSL